MAGRGIRIPILADVADVLRGTRQVSDSLDQVDSKLQQVDRTGKQTADGTTWTQYSSHARKAQADVEATGHRVKESMSEVRSEAMQNAGEAVSQMAASGASASDTIAGTFGGLVGSLGPVGAAVAGIGGIAFGAWIQHAKHMAEMVDTYSQQAVTNLTNTGKLIVTTNDDVNASIAGNVTKLSGWANAARLVGVDQIQLIKAMNGNQAAADQLIPKLEAIATAHMHESGAGRGLTRSMDETGQKAQELARDLRDNAAAAKQAETNAILYAQAIDKLPRKVDVVFNQIVRGNAPIPASGFRGSTNNRIN